MGDFPPLAEFDLGRIVIISAVIVEISEGACRGIVGSRLGPRRKMAPFVLWRPVCRRSLRLVLRKRKTAPSVIGSELVFRHVAKIGAETDLSVSSREEDSVEKITVGILFVHVFAAAQHIVEGAAGPCPDDHHGPERSGVAFEVEHPLRGFERDHIVLDGRRLGAVIVRVGGKNASSYKNSN